MLDCIKKFIKNKKQRKALISKNKNTSWKGSIFFIKRGGDVYDRYIGEKGLENHRKSRGLGLKDYRTQSIHIERR